MSILVNKAMSEMRNKSIDITKNMIEREQIKKVNDQASNQIVWQLNDNKNTKVSKNDIVFRIIQALFWLMLAYLSFRTLL